MLFASDLDQTLIHSYKIAGPSELCVEEKDGKALSYMTRRAYDGLQAVSRRLLFAPVTTRSLAQYRRLRLLDGAYPRYAVVGNGGILLVDHECDAAWLRESRRLAAPARPELARGMRLLRSDARVYFDVRLVDDLFVFTKSGAVAATLTNLRTRLDLSRVDVCNHGEKVYILPRLLNKGVAVRRLKERLGARRLLCAGDSAFDLPMLRRADLAFVPDRALQAALPDRRRAVLCAPAAGRRFADQIVEYLLTRVLTK